MKIIRFRSIGVSALLFVLLLVATVNLRAQTRVQRFVCHRAPHFQNITPIWIAPMIASAIV